MAGKAAKFLGKLGQKLARNVYNEAGEALQGHMRTAADLRATLAPCCNGAAHQYGVMGHLEPHLFALQLLWCQLSLTAAPWGF